MLLTTTHTIEGYAIESYLGVVTGEVIVGANFLKDFAARIHDFFGGRAGSYENTLVKAKENALREMQERAGLMGANAIIGIDIDYETLGETNSMLMVACSGTAVRVAAK
ncbi:MAG: heavy metal-binding domain-containing protein [Bacteroidaceae bacterium]|nr:heavy metal-binding domain-containing protein [Bacteroidaceae bacterium]